MWKMLPKQLAKLNKLKLEKETSSTVKLTSSLNPSKSKTLNNNILHRENIVSAVLLRELQETIDSGKIDEDLAKLGIVLKSVIMHGKHSSTVTWQSQGMPLDQHIYQTLTRHAAEIRHIIMHSHVIGIVPTFKFAIDTFAEEQFQVSEIFASENFDMGEPEHTDENSIFSKDDDDSEVKERSSNKQDSTDATFELFQIDVASLQQKIKENKLKTGKSNISAIGTSVSDA